jgi:hypothetical protein
LGESCNARPFRVDQGRYGRSGESYFKQVASDVLAFARKASNLGAAAVADWGRRLDMHLRLIGSTKLCDLSVPMVRADRYRVIGRALRPNLQNVRCQCGQWWRTPCGCGASAVRATIPAGRTSKATAWLSCTMSFHRNGIMESRPNIVIRVL